MHVVITKTIRLGEPLFSLLVEFAKSSFVTYNIEFHLFCSQPKLKNNALIAIYFGQGSCKVARKSGFQKTCIKSKQN